MRSRPKALRSLIFALLTITLMITPGPMASGSSPTSAAHASLQGITDGPGLVAHPTREDVSLEWSTSPRSVVVTAGGLAAATAVGKPLSPSTPMEVSFSLADRNPGAMGQVGVLESYLVANDLQVSRTGSMFLVKGTAGEMENAFHTTLDTYHTGTGSPYWAPVTAPTLPVSIAPAVSSILGLNTLARPVTFQTFPSEVTDVLKGSTIPAPTKPQSAITVVLSTPRYYVAGGTSTILDPPTGQNVTFTATAALPSGDTCPCKFRWVWGDGSRQEDDVSSTTDSPGHAYLQAFNQFSTPIQIRVNVSDKQVQYGQAGNTVMPTLSASWMQTAYGEKPLFAKGYSGQGFTVGLDEMCDSTFDSGTANYSSTVATFSSAMGLPAPTLTYTGNGTRCPSGDGISGWSTETILDMDWAHAMAPNATLQVYFGQSSQGADIAGGDALWANATNGVFLASNSWGITEPYALSGPGIPGLFDSIWTQARSNATLFSSSGDCGGTANLTSPESSYGYNVSYPADNPDGVGVGGTIVQTDTSGNLLNDYAWNSTAYVPNGPACTKNNYGTGGGFSRDYSAPSYQQKVTGPGWVPPKKWPIADPRGVPDVAMDAATYVDIYYPGDSSIGYPAGWYPTGGTSLASPMWAATTSVVLQSLNRHFDSTTHAFLNVPLYTVGESSAYLTSFHDVTLGTNADPYGYSAAVGWDATTGWGSPNATGLSESLAWAIPVTYVVSGIVSDSTTKLPISGATVTASGGQGIVMTATNGSFTLNLANGTSTLTATHTGYNPNTLSVSVNGQPLSNQDILLYSKSQGASHVISGVMISQTHKPLQGGKISVTGPMVASATTGPGGLFTLYLLNGTYSLTGSEVVPQPWINPAYNSTTISLSVTGPTSDLVVTLDYALSTITGRVLSEANGQALPGAQVSGFDIFFVATTADAQGRYYLHMPTGPASLTAAASGYLNATDAAFVNENGTATQDILLQRAQIAPDQYTVGIRVVAPLNLTLGIPEVKGQSSVEVEVWANNSTTGAPQYGLKIALGDTLGGSFSSATLTLPPSGMATVEYIAPKTLHNVVGILGASVGTTGAQGTASAPIQVLSDYCGSSCPYPVNGQVLSNGGAPVSGATVYLKDSIGKTTITTATTSSKGLFSFTEPEASYTITATQKGYQAYALQHFNVTPAMGPLLIILVPTPSPIGTNQGFSPVVIVIPVLLAAILGLTLYVLWRRFRAPPPKREGEGTESSRPAPIDAEAEIFPARPALDPQASPSLPPPPTEPSESSAPPEPSSPPPPEKSPGADTGTPGTP